MYNVDTAKQVSGDLKAHLGLLLLSGLLLAMSSVVAIAAPQQPSVVVPDTPFIEAVRDGDIEEIQGAIVRGQNLDGRDKSGSPALFVALQFNQTEVFEFLIENGARVKVKDRSGDTLLTALATTKHFALVELILKSGGDPDRFGANGEPPLIIATRAGEIEIVRLLLAYDVDVEATDLTGRSALAIADERRSRVIADLLRDAGAY